MIAEIVVRGAGAADLTRDLFAWLIEEPDLRGKARIVERAPLPGALGPVAEALQVALGSGGAVTMLATVAVTWLHHRVGKVTVTFTKGKGHPSLEVTAHRVKMLDAEGIQALVAEISDMLKDGRSAEGTAHEDE